jgi:hypothetical protein
MLNNKDIERGEKANRVPPTAQNEPNDRLARGDLRLVVVDVPLEGKPKVLLCKIFSEDDMEHELSSLPLHDLGVARIYNYVHHFSDHEISQLRVHIEKTSTYLSEFELSPDGSDAYDIDDIQLQWNNCSSGPNNVNWAKALGYGGMSCRDGIYSDSAATYIRCLPIGTDRLIGTYILTLDFSR